MAGWSLRCAVVAAMCALCQGVGYSLKRPGPGYTTEDGGVQQFKLEFETETPPSPSVTVDIRLSDSTEATVSPSVLLITPENYNETFVVNVTGVDDAEADGDVWYGVVFSMPRSADERFRTFSSEYIIQNLDNEVTPAPDGDLTPAPVSPPDSPMERFSYSIEKVGPGFTTEGGGVQQFKFRFATDSPPNPSATLDISVTDSTEATVSPSVFLITPENYADAFVVNVTGVDDAEADGDMWYDVVFSSPRSADERYRSVSSSSTIQNLDNDVSPAPSTVPAPTEDSGDTFPVWGIVVIALACVAL